MVFHENNSEDCIATTAWTLRHCERSATICVLYSVFGLFMMYSRYAELVGPVFPFGLLSTVCFVYSPRFGPGS